MELNEALAQISEIRAQVARTQTFGGFRSLTVGFSGALGIAAALLQAKHILRPTEEVWNYVDLWSSVAALSLLVVGIELVSSFSSGQSALKRRLTLLAIRQFIPCLFAGGAVTGVVVLVAQETAWMLPGLWAILFSLGVFACSRLLPRPTFWIGAYYLVSGIVCLALGKGGAALSPWMMAGTFGIGQLLAAGLLYCTLEREHAAFET